MMKPKRQEDTLSTLTMKINKQHNNQPVPYRVRDVVELVLILLVIAGGFAWILHATSRSFIHSHLANYTWWKTTAYSWTKIHTSMFDQFTQDDFDLDLDNHDNGVDSEQQNLYHVESVLSKLKSGENFETILSSMKLKDVDEPKVSGDVLTRKKDHVEFMDMGRPVSMDGPMPVKVKNVDRTKIGEDVLREARGKEDRLEFMDVDGPASVSAKHCTVPGKERFDCHPEKKASEVACLMRGCCWQKGGSCYYPLNYEGYKVAKVSRENDIDFLIDLTKTKKSYYPRDIMQLTMEVDFQTDYRLRIKIYDPNDTRWEVPTVGPKIINKKFSNDEYLYSFTDPAPGQPFFLTVTRTATNTTILNTTGAFMFNDQFLQLSYFLPSFFIYGLGEHRDTLLHSLDSHFVFWNKDQVPGENTNLYGSHPFYLMMETDGNSHGVLLLNSNAMEAVLQPAPAITWRTIGGILDFYIFLGPTPADVINQYTELIGRTFMPPYWSLGFHQCRWGYTSAEQTQGIADNLTKAGMPQDVQWNDIDYMDSKRDFTTSLVFGNQTVLVDTLHSQGKHYMMIVDPGISDTKKGSYLPYDLGMSLHIFINNSNDKTLVGKENAYKSPKEDVYSIDLKPLQVWPGTTVFPDFTNPVAQHYWTTLVKGFHDNVSFDGMWIDMNEISNFVDGSVSGCSFTDRYEHPPYVPGVKGGYLSYTTICASAKQYLSRTYNVHNLYGLGETNASYQALMTARPGKRPFIISRSTFPGQGHYGGHWTGDNDGTYYDMYKSISDILSFNLFGIPMVGADICGFRGNTTEGLCQRWYQLGAFYPFSRSHNIDHARDQDPTAFSEALLNSTRNVYLTRYSLLPYLYTLFHKSHVTGETVARPLFFEFPSDRMTYNVDRQFLWGPALMISPVLDEDFRVEPYFPQTTWFSFSTGARTTDQGGTIPLPAPLDFINLNVRGGYIIPMQEPALTTTQSRKNSFWLLVALNRSLNATGDLYWDDGDSIDSYEKGAYNMLEFTAQNNTVKSSITHAGYTSEPMTLGNVTVLGVLTQPKSVTLNGKTTPFSYNQQHERKMLISPPRKTYTR